MLREHFSEFDNGESPSYPWESRGKGAGRRQERYNPLRR